MTNLLDFFTDQNIQLFTAFNNGAIAKSLLQQYHCILVAFDVLLKQKFFESYVFHTKRCRDLQIKIDTFTLVTISSN